MLSQVQHDKEFMNNPHIITLGVRDLVKSRALYEAVFGWRVSSASQDEIVFFDTGGVIVSLYPWHSLAQDAMVEEAGAGFQGITHAHCVGRKEDVVAFLEKAQKAGAKVVKPAQDTTWGGFSGYFRDFDTHLWEIAWNPHFPIDQNGKITLP